MALMLTRAQAEYFDVHHIRKVYSLFELVTEEPLHMMRSFVKNV